jgi:hypothetical protein
MLTVKAVCAAAAFTVCALASGGVTPTQAAMAPPRIFKSGFESATDFAGMYTSPQTASTRHALVSSPRHAGKRAHCAWLTGPGTAADTDGPNHRGYPTVQLFRVPPGGGFATPTVVRLWVWADVAMKPGQWVSLATLSADASNAWTRVVTVNLDPGGWINVFHVPDQGAHVPEIETHRPFPMRRWVQLKIRIDFDPQHGFIEVFQDGVLVARAEVRGGHGRLEQAHFGMYAISSLTSGTVCNDDLKITAART